MVERELPFASKIDPMFRRVRSERQPEGESGGPATEAFFHNYAIRWKNLYLDSRVEGRRLRRVVFVPFAPSEAAAGDDCGGAPRTV